MKKTIFLSALLYSGIAFSQVGTDTVNPQGVLHIDGGKDNPVTGTPSVVQQANDVVITSSGNMGIGTTTPSTKVEITKTSPGAVKITDGTQGNNKIFISNANGRGTWQNTSPAVVIDSNAGSVLTIFTTSRNVGASATVTIPGYYIITPRFISDKTPVDCGSFVAYNLSTNPTTLENQAFLSDAHFPAGSGSFDFMYSSGIAYLQAGTYYMFVRRGGACTTYTSRNNMGQNSFTLILLK